MSASKPSTVPTMAPTGASFSRSFSRSRPAVAALDGQQDEQQRAHEDRPERHGVEQHLRSADHGARTARTSRVSPGHVSTSPAPKSMDHTQVEPAAKVVDDQ
jgi:hypothetical protein